MLSDDQSVHMVIQLLEEERGGTILDIHTNRQLVSAVCMVSSLTSFTAELNEDDGWEVIISDSTLKQDILTSFNIYSESPVGHHHYYKNVQKVGFPVS